MTGGGRLNLAEPESEIGPMHHHQTCKDKLSFLKLTVPPHTKITRTTSQRDKLFGGIPYHATNVQLASSTMA